jgi:hypothetical protein
LENRTDLEAVSVQEYAHYTKYKHASARAWFQEFMKDNLPDQYNEKYFETRGPAIYPPSVFKSYAVYLAQSRPGRINTKIAVTSIISILSQLFTQIERQRRCQLLKVDKDDVQTFVRYDLKDQEGLTTAMLAKPLATAEDTSYIFSVLYSPSYLVTFLEMRIVFNITLFINLMVDAANRGGDMLDNLCKFASSSLINVSSGA